MAEQDYLTPPVFNGYSTDGTIRSTRDLQPAHFLLKIESCSLLCENGPNPNKSDIFEAGGHKWTLCFYPKGNHQSGGDDHISLYLKLADAKSLPRGWEVNANFTFLLFDQHYDKYLSIQDGTIRRFHEMKTEWGVPQLLSLDIFSDASNGYLVKDCCVFGVEIFVLQHTGRRMDCLSMVKKPFNNTYSWKTKNVSTLHKAFNCIGSFLCYSEYQCLTSNQKAYYKLRIKNQLDIKSNLEYAGTIRSTRDLRLAHFLFKIESYSLLCETEAEKYVSGSFEAGGHKWLEVVFLSKGKLRKSSEGPHLADTTFLSSGWEVNAKFTFFVFDQLQDRYLTIQDGVIRRFHKTKTEWGVPQLLSIDIFNDVSKGYLVDNCCVFGVEVFLLKHTGRIECLSMVKNPSNNIYTWYINNFSACKAYCCYSEGSIVQGIPWQLIVYPKGDSKSKGGLSVYLCKFEKGLFKSSNQKVYAEFKLRVKNQLDNKSNLERTAKTLFCATTPPLWGFSHMISLKDLKDTSKGYVSNGSLILESELIILSLKSFS